MRYNIIKFFEIDRYSILSFFGIKIKMQKKWRPVWYTRLFTFFQLLDKYVPKKKNKIIFCSWPDFSDNAKELYEYLNTYHKDEYEIVWTYRNNENYVFLKEKLHCKLVYHFSLQAIVETLTSKYICVTHDDMFCYDYKKHIVLQLFHGMPVKAVGFAEKI